MAEDDSKFGIVHNMNEQKRMAFEYAKAYIEDCRRRVHGAGNNDTEYNRLNDILEQLKNNQIDSNLACQAAEEVVSSKQDH